MWTLRNGERVAMTPGEVADLDARRAVEPVDDTAPTLDDVIAELDAKGVLRRADLGRRRAR